MATLIDMNEWQVLQHIKSMFGELGFCHISYGSGWRQYVIGWRHTDGDGYTWYGATWREAYDAMSRDPLLNAMITLCKAKTPNENVGQWTTIVFEKEK